MPKTAASKIPTEIAPVTIATALSAVTGWDVSPIVLTGIWTGLETRPTVVASTA